jgi:hypothetical protein
MCQYITKSVSSLLWSVKDDLGMNTPGVWVRWGLHWADDTSDISVRNIRRSRPWRCAVSARGTAPSYTTQPSPPANPYAGIPRVWTGSVAPAWTSHGNFSSPPWTLIGSLHYMTADLGSLHTAVIRAQTVPSRGMHQPPPWRPGSLPRPLVPHPHCMPASHSLTRL